MGQPLVKEDAMSIDPLLEQSEVIQIHAFAAMAAFIVAITQFALPKGTPRHRAVGYAWAGLMVLVVVPSFWIHELRMWGPWSWIHLLSIYTLIMLPLAVVHARGHRVNAHRNSMIGLFLGALLIAGVFTLLPGRVMNRVIFGN
jgi:uncharacterized membrane protein